MDENFFGEEPIMEVHDYFTPPSNFVVCDLCHVEVEAFLTTDLLAHLRDNHPKEYTEVEK